METRWIPEESSARMLAKYGDETACECGHAHGVHSAKTDMCLVNGCSCERFVARIVDEKGGR